MCEFHGFNETNEDERERDLARLGDNRVRLGCLMWDAACCTGAGPGTRPHPHPWTRGPGYDRLYSQRSIQGQ